ncbi:hypothetical protein Cpin_7129 [Chitinophaga pinensis DSM 2588]|uniref:Uncharacterized protein n=2 Tax=Chitinophaga pinensis TaxID=79329 RepID=A0A979GBR4_CHIPD|nr:hypothetical protein Cpin_7129 [Chitinophaga pinensis DSM 2588]
MALAQAQAAQADTLGTLILSIDNSVKATPADKSPDSTLPWVSIAETDTEIKRLINPDEIVLPFTRARLIIDYPLNNPAIFELSASGKGFTRKELIKYIGDKYHMIYEEEEQSATTKTVPLNERKELINRNTTDGKYGVWGHDLSDLSLSTIEVYRDDKGQISLVLDINS